MAFFKLGVFAAVATLLAAPVVAQGWDTRADFTRQWFFGGAGLEGGPIGFGCVGHYEGADWSYGEGISPLDPYIIHISMNETIGVPGTPQFTVAAPLTDVIFSIGNTGYQLPGVVWNEMVGDWEAHISVGDPLVAALLAGGDAQLWSGGALVGDLPGQGLASSMAAAINFCDGHWIASGAALPTHAAATVQALRAAPISMEQAVLDRVTSHCGGEGQVRADAISHSDFDGDGREDVLLHWSGVTCTQGPNANQRGAGECGAENCLTSAYVSGVISAGGAPYDLLASSARVDPNAATDILLGVDPQICAQLSLQPSCIARQRWNGTEFATVP